MDNSLLVNTPIRKILCQDDDIKNMLTDNFGQIKIFPVIAKAGATYPYVVVNRDSVTPEYTKDGCYMNVVNVSIFVVDPTYDKCVGLANKIRNKLDLCRYTDDDIYIDRIELLSATEYVSEEAYGEELIFEVSMSN